MALGKGLGEILEEMGRVYEKGLDVTPDEYAGDEIGEIDLELIDPNPYQPRKSFDEKSLAELAESIRMHGLLQPVVLFPWEGRYLLIAGERRLRAHKIAGIPKIKAIVAAVDFDESRMRQLALVENIQREDLNPMDLARSYKELIEVHGLTHEELSGIVHKSRSQISNTLRLLALDDYVAQKVAEGKITQGHAKILVSLPAREQRIVADTVIGRRLSVRETERLVQNSKKRGVSSKKSENIFRLDEEAKELLGEIFSPFRHKIRKKSVELIFESESEYEKFVSFMKKRS